MGVTGREAQKALGLCSAHSTSSVSDGPLSLRQPDGYRWPEGPLAQAACTPFLMDGNAARDGFEGRGGGHARTLDSAGLAPPQGASSRPGWVGPPQQPGVRRGGPQCSAVRPAAVAPPAGRGWAAPSRWAGDAQPVCCTNRHAARTRARRPLGPKHPGPPRPARHVGSAWPAGGAGAGVS